MSSSTCSTVTSKQLHDGMCFLVLLVLLVLVLLVLVLLVLVLLVLSLPSLGRIIPSFRLRLCLPLPELASAER
jgi:hypothetical protein